MRVRTNHLRVHERRTLAGADVCDGLAQRVVAREVVGAVHLVDLQSGEARDHARQIAARRLHFDRRRDRVPVVFDQVEHRQVAGARRVQRFPELALARRSFADGDERDLVAFEFRLAIGNVGEALVESSRFGDADAVQALRRDGAARGRNVQPRVRPVRRHLPAAGCRIVRGADRAEEHVERRDADRQRQRAIAVIREEPVVPRSKVLPGRDEHGLVPRAADLEKCLALILELNLLVVDLPRQEHEAIGGQKILRRPLRAHFRAVGEGRPLHG